MATGGFKAFEHVFTGSDYTSSTSFSTGETAVKALVKAITQGIIATEPHWGYDSNFTATANDFVKIGSSSSKWYDACFAQFLINTNTGSKLLVYYNTNYSISVYSNDLVLSYDSSWGVYGFGLCMSMIPGGSSQTWDTTSNCSTASFLPNEATPISGTSTKATGIGSTASQATFISTSGSHRYVIAIKEDVILVFWQDVNSGNLNGAYAIGKIFGQLCNSSDNGVCSQYGCLNFNRLISSGTTTYSESAVTPCNLNSRTIPFIYIASGTNTYSIIIGMNCSYFKISTAAKPESNFDTSQTRLSASTQRAFDNGTASSSTSNKTVFTPFLMGGINVGADSVLKGYLDTDVFRGVYPGFPYNTLFDNGKFIYVGSGLAVGWDASNTVILRT